MGSVNPPVGSETPLPQRPGESDADYQNYLDSLSTPEVAPQRAGESDADYQARLVADSADPDYEKFTAERAASKAPPVQQAGESDEDYQKYLAAREAHVDEPEYLAFLADQRTDRFGAAPAQFYVHLADGNVVVLSTDDMNAAGSHVDGIAVIGRYLVGA